MDATDTQSPQKITIEVVTKNAQNEAEEQQKKSEPRLDTGIDYKYNFEYHRFCNDLGLDSHKRENMANAQKLALIYDWTKENIESDDGARISQSVRDLIRTLGFQNIRGELLVDSLFRWIRMDMEGEKSRIKNKQKELLNKELEIKQEIKKIEPKISEKELEERITEGMKEMQKQIKRKVKSRVTASINRGIREAILKAANI